MDKYDIIIVGSGAGGGTLAHALTDSGKKILIIERGDYLKREIENWLPESVLQRKSLSHKRGLVRQKGQTFHSRHELVRRRQYQSLRSCTSSPSQGRFWRDQALWGSLTRLANEL